MLYIELRLLPKTKSCKVFSITYKHCALSHNSQQIEIVPFSFLLFCSLNFFFFDLILLEHNWWSIASNLLRNDIITRSYNFTRPIVKLGCSFKMALKVNFNPLTYQMICFQSL